MKFKKWFETFITEKGYDLEAEIFDVDTARGFNIIEGGVLLEAIMNAPANEQTAIKNQLVRIDFHNGKLRPFFEHLAKAMATVAEEARS